MKKNIQLCLLMAAALFLFSVAKTQAQSAAPAAYHQKDMIGDNPTADRDIKAVSDFTYAIVSGDIPKVKTLLADKFKGYGPAPTDSASAEQMTKMWQENYKTQSDRKVNFVAQSFRVLSGDLQGNWVSVWGDYTFTSDGKTVQFPYQCTYHVTNGKIDSSRIYYDQLYIVQKLGFTLTPPVAAK
jgi:ketosteroid isomerase-like protein